MPQNRLLSGVLGAMLAVGLAAPALAHDSAWYDSNWDVPRPANLSAATPAHPQAVKATEPNYNAAWYDSNWDVPRPANVAAPAPARQATVKAPEEKTASRASGAVR